MAELGMMGENNSWTQERPPPTGEGKEAILLKYSTIGSDLKDADAIFEAWCWMWVWE